MKNTYLFFGMLLLVVIIICISCAYKVRKDEHFTNKNNILLNDYNLLTNASFQNGKDVGEFLIKKGNNSIIKLQDNPNCNISKYVLQQNIIKEGSKYIDSGVYVISAKTRSSYYYKFRVWTTGLDDAKNNLISIKTIDNNVCKSSEELNVKSEIIDKKKINNMIWYEYELIFMTPSNRINNILIYLGCNKIFTKRYFTNLILLPYLPKVPNFDATIGLQTYLDAQNRYSCSNGESLIWNDLSSNGFLYKWYKKPLWSNEGYFNTKDNILTGPSSAELLDRSQEFSFIIHSKGLNKDNKKNDSSLYIPGSPGANGTAIQITIPNNYDKISIILNGKEYKTKEKIIPQNDNIYILTFKNNVAKLWVNDNMSFTFNNIDRPYFNEKSIKLNKNGNWHTNLYEFFVYNVELTKNKIDYINYFLRYRPSKLIKPITPLITPIKPIVPIKPIIPSELIKNKYERYKEDCHKYCKDYYGNITECRNKIKACGYYCNDPRSKDDQICYGKENDKCPNVYLKDNEYIVNIPCGSKYAKIMGYGERSYGTSKERAHIIYKENFPNCEIPKILRFERVTHDVCPYIFAKSNPCNESDCKNVDWKSSDFSKNLPEGCRKQISHYCHIPKHRDNDPNCKCWKKINMYDPECQKIRREYEPPEDYGFNINIFDIEEHPDFKNYIRKDKIPCWNCNLTAPTIDDSVIKTRNWENINNLK